MKTELTRRISVLVIILTLFMTAGFSALPVRANSADDGYPAARSGEVAAIERSGETEKFNTLAEAQAGLQEDGETIIMLADTSEDNLPYAGGSFTLDLNGKTVTTKGFTLSGNTELTITDSAEAKGSLQLTSTDDKTGIAN